MAPAFLFTQFEFCFNWCQADLLESEFDLLDWVSWSYFDDFIQSGLIRVFRVDELLLVWILVLFAVLSLKTGIITSLGDTVMFREGMSGINVGTQRLTTFFSGCPVL